VKVIILGGCGFIGSSIARDLIKSEQVIRVTLFDKNTDMSKVADSVKTSQKVTVKHLDVNISFAELVRAISDNDVVVNCVGPYSEDSINTVKAAIEAGVTYTDVCDNCVVTKKIFELDEAAKKAGVCVCTGLGSTPGVTNMLAKYGADRLDTVDEIDVFFVIALIDPIGTAGLTQAMGQFTGNVTQYIDGQLMELPAGSGAEEVEFLPPFGMTEVYYARHPESFTLPLYIPGVKKVINKASFSPASVPRLFAGFIELGLFSPIPLTVGDCTVSPRDFIVAFMQERPELRGQQQLSASLAVNVIVKGTEESSRVTYAYRVSDWGGPLTAIPASISVQMLSREETAVKGVLAPEAVFHPEEYFLELKKKGLHFSEKKTVGNEFTL
jgi:saccharopine dehydrogenase-like NADP-dependent oxidoreductase